MKKKDDMVHVRDSGGTYIARWRGESSSCTAGQEAAARAVIRKALRGRGSCAVCLFVVKVEGHGRYAYRAEIHKSKPGDLHGHSGSLTIDELTRSAAGATK